MEGEVDEIGGCQLGTPVASPLLPDEMVFEFLLRLSVENLNQCNCVSKAWRSLIRSPAFIQAYKDRHIGVGLLVIVPDEATGLKISHYQYSPIGFRRQAEPVLRLKVPLPDDKYDGITEVVQGLVCCYNGNHLFVCNIFTGKVMPLPHTGSRRKYFLGFDAVNGVYKLLGINSHSVEILTLGIGTDCCWRVVNADIETGVKRALMKSRRICVDGVWYWMVVKERSRRKARCFLCSFDLNEEKFRYIKIARGLTSKCLLSLFFAKFQGRLSLSAPTQRGGCRLSLYVLEDDEGNIWTKHSIPLPEGLNKGDGCTFPVGNLPDGKILLLNPLLGEELSTPIYSYDHQTCKFDRLIVGKFPWMELENITEASDVMISCVEENLIASDILLKGTKAIEGYAGDFTQVI